MSTRRTPFHREQALARFAAMAAAHKKSVGKQIRRLREERGWTQLQLANQIPAETVDASYVSKWERGVYYPDDHLEALAKALRTTPGTIMAGLANDVEQPTETDERNGGPMERLRQIEEKLDDVLDWIAGQESIRDADAADRASDRVESPGGEGRAASDTRRKAR